MLGYKLLGAALILLCGGIASLTASRKEKTKLSVLDAWLELLLHMRGQIDCYLTPQDDLLHGASVQTLRACMGKGYGDTPRSLLARSAPYLDAESHRLLSAFIEELGSCYREEQLRRCDYYLQALRATRQKVAAELPARVKLCSALCICASVGTAILLW